MAVGPVDKDGMTWHWQLLPLMPTSYSSVASIHGDRLMEGKVGPSPTIGGETWCRPFMRININWLTGATVMYLNAMMEVYISLRITDQAG